MEPANLIETQLAPADTHDNGSHPTPAGAGPSNTPRSNACLACRKVKMRCIASYHGQSKCQRCLRKALDCVFQQHRRGRKPGTRMAKVPKEGRVRPTRPASTTGIIATRAPTVSSSRRQSIQEAADWETGALQPSGLLEHSATHGQFSLRNILNTVDTSPSLHVQNPTNENISLVIPLDDPVKLGLVSLSVASHLFQSFICKQNPFINQLDPKLHTLDYTRQRSSFLTSAVLAVAVKGSDTLLYERLLDHAEDLLTTSFRRGHKSTEIIQAVMVLTHWKKPDDNRAWISLGYAVRMGMELGWHKLRKYPSPNQQTSSIAPLEDRNIQRTWFILFVYDRSMSLQTGKPWMIEQCDFIESIEAWCNDPLATQGDRLLGAFVTLRLLSSEVFKVLGPSSTCTDNSEVHSLDSFLTIIKSQIDKWGLKWTRSVSRKSCHPFLISFYGAHLRLQLFSLPLQAALSRRDAIIESHLEAFWTSYSSAVEMLRLICQHIDHARLAQDSVHVMAAYCAKFLIKLLLSSPSSVTEPLKAEVLQTIENAAHALSFDIPSPAHSSCTLQAAFLRKLIANYVGRRTAQKQGRQAEHARPNSKNAENTSRHHGLSNRSQRNDLTNAMDSGRTPSTTRPGHAFDALGGPVDYAADGESLFIDHNFLGLDAVFADELTWDDIFSSAEN